MDRNIIIVGGSDGIGLACAKLFEADNDRVANISRSPCELSHVKNFSADVTSPALLAGAFEALSGQFDCADVLVYCAGTSMAAPLEFVRDGDVSYLFDVNCMGAIRTLKLALPLLKRRGGKIFLASSVASVFPILYDGPYSASKAALEAVGRELRMELEGTGVSVTSIRIGGTRTHFTFKRKVYSPEESGSYAQPLATAAGTLARIEQLGMPPEKVAQHIFELSRRKNPPYVSTPGLKNKFSMALLRLLPDRLLMSLVRRMQSRAKE